MAKAIICKLTNVRKHPGADRLNLSTVLGNQVVVGLNNTDGQLGIFFQTDLQLSEKFCLENDLLRRKNLDGSPAGGMFDQTIVGERLAPSQVWIAGMFLPASNAGEVSDKPIASFSFSVLANVVAATSHRQR